MADIRLLERTLQQNVAWNRARINSAQRPLPVKRHGRKVVSIFRHGLDHLRRILCNQLCEAERVALRRVIKLLSCT